MKTKHICSWFLLVLACLLMPVTLFAQDSTIAGVTQEMMDAPIKDWQLNLTTLAIAAMILGRVYKSIRSGGGIRGIYRGLVYGENVPKNVLEDYPTPKKGDGGVALVLLTAGILAISTPFMGGCQTVKQATPEQVDMAATVTQLVVSQIVVPVLANNPEYEGALLAVAAGVDVAFAAQEVTPEGINSFLDTVALKYSMDAKTRIYIGSGIMDMLTLYKQTYQTTVVASSDPRVVKMLNSFRDGIKQGVERYHALSGK